MLRKTPHCILALFNRLLPYLKVAEQSQAKSSLRGPQIIRLGAIGGKIVQVKIPSLGRRVPRPAH